VRATGAVSAIPIAGPRSNTSFFIEGRPQPDPAHEPDAEIRTVAGDYFRAMGIPLLRGRVFDARDRSGAERAYVIDETLAKRDFPNQDPIGRRLIVPWGENLVGTIVGVVGPVHHLGLKEPPHATIYWPDAQNPMRSFYVATRTSGSPQRLMDGLRAQVQALDPELPIAELRPVRDIVEQDVARPRFLLALLGFFAGAALLLAGIGLYGVISYSVTQRTREIGVRMALGASPQSVVGMVVRQGMTVTAIGLIAGLVAALIAGKLIAAALYGVHPRDPVTLLAASVFLALVALLACWIPAQRAARTDPMVALRQE
jgi:putative ABC transport system permease protein